MLSGHCQRSNHGAWAGHDLHRNALFIAQLHQRFAGIGDTGHACIRDHTAGFAGKQPADDVLGDVLPAVLVVTEGRRVDVEMGQQFSCHTGVLRCNEIHLLQQAQLAHGDVLQIADGRADDI